MRGLQGENVISKRWGNTDADWKKTNKKVAKLVICQVRTLCEADRTKREQSLTVREGNVCGSGGKNR